MAKDWEWDADPFASGRCEAWRAFRGHITMDVWSTPEGEWLANATLTAPNSDGDTELYMQIEDSFETRELAQLAIIDRVREVIETFHADFRGAE